MLRSLNKEGFNLDQQGILTQCPQMCFEVLFGMLFCLLLGATVMYEVAHRTGIEVGGDLSSDVVAIHYCKQRDYYAASLCCLKLCCHDYQWLVRPANVDKG